MCLILPALSSLHSAARWQASSASWMCSAFWCCPLSAANTGGITRDILIGAVPPAAINDWQYLGVSLAAGIITFYFPSAIMRRWNPVLLFDAAGLALFAVSGAHKALVYGLNPVMATLLGMLTGIGGGMARDILLANSDRLACGPVCRGGLGWCGGSRDRKHAGTAFRCRGACGSGSLLRASRPRHQKRLATSGRWY